MVPLSAEQGHAEHPRQDDDEGQRGEHREAEPTEPDDRLGRIEPLLGLGNDGHAVVDVQEKDDRRDEERERRGHQHQEDRPRQPRDDQHRRDERVEHRDAVDVVLGPPGAPMRRRHPLGRHAGQLGGAPEQVPAARRHHPRPAVEVVERGREGGRERAAEEHEHHGRAGALGEDEGNLADHRVAGHLARIERDRGQQQEDGREHERHDVSHREVQDADAEPAAAVLLRVRRQLRDLDAQVVRGGREGVERTGVALALELFPDAPHAHPLRLAPLRGLQRDVDAGRQQPEKRRDDEPRPAGDLDREEVPHLRQRRRVENVDSHRRHEQDAGQHLGGQLDRRVASVEDDAHREHPQPQPVHPARQPQPEVLREHEEQHRGGRREPARLTQRALNQGRDQHVPDRPLARRGGVGVEHAAPGGVREPERHLEAVVLEDVGDGDAPEQRILEPAAGRRGGHQMARADAGHHQDETGTEVPEHPAGAGLGQRQLVERVGFVGHARHPTRDARTRRR